MKRTLQTFLIGLCVYQTSLAQTNVTGISSSQPPYLNALIPNATITSVFTATQTIGTYTMSGTPDGSGALDNGNGTFTFFTNHEFGNNAGSVRAHGSTGSFISKWVISKSTFSVISGADLIQNVNLWNGTSYTTYNASNSSTLAAFARFCSGDLPPMSAFYNVFNGYGTQERIFMNGEENGDEGRSFAHVVTGTFAGTSWELPYIGKCSRENSVASPYCQDKTIVVGLDDQTPGQVYFYVGMKTNTGNDIQKAGLTGGKLYGVSVASLAAETSTGIPAPNTPFSLIDLGNVSAITGASLNTQSNNLGVTTFLRPEDGAWNPMYPNEFYFVTTNSFASPSRLWKLKFTDIRFPELGGTITALLDGTEGQKMMDNICVDNCGHIFIQEDVGNNAWNGKIYQYNIATDALDSIARHDPSRFINGGANFLTQDEESSGIFDAQSILGPGMFMFVDQAHYAIPNPVVEGGQFLSLFNPTTSAVNPEVNVMGNGSNINDGTFTVTTANNTDLGTVANNSSKTATFVVQNLGQGPLSVTQVGFSNVNSGEFSLVNPPSFPWIIAPANSVSFTVLFAPTGVGTRVTDIHLVNTDINEDWYDFRIQGNSVNTTGILNINSTSIFATLYPNPTDDEVTVKLSLEKNERVAIDVFDLQGKIVSSFKEKELEKGDQKITFNTSSLKSGLYIVQVKSGDKLTKMEMVITH